MLTLCNIVIKIYIKMNLKNTYLILVVTMVLAPQSQGMFLNGFTRNPGEFNAQGPKPTSLLSEFVMITNQSNISQKSKRSFSQKSPVEYKNKPFDNSFKLADLSSVRSIEAPYPHDYTGALRNALHFIKNGQSQESILLPYTKDEFSEIKSEKNILSIGTGYSLFEKTPPLQPQYKNNLSNSNFGKSQESIILPSPARDDSSDPISMPTAKSIYPDNPDKETQTTPKKQKEAGTQTDPAENPAPIAQKIDPSSAGTQTDPAEKQAPIAQKIDPSSAGTQTDPAENPAPIAQKIEDRTPVYVPTYTAYSAKMYDSWAVSTAKPDAAAAAANIKPNTDAPHTVAPAAPSPWSETAMTSAASPATKVEGIKQVKGPNTEIKKQPELEKPTAPKSVAKSASLSTNLHKLILHFVTPAKNLWSNVRRLFRKNFALPTAKEELPMSKKQVKYNKKSFRNTKQSARRPMQELWIEFLSPFKNLWSDVHGFFKRPTLKNHELPENISIHERPLQYRNISAFQPALVRNQTPSRKQSKRFVAARTKRMYAQLANLGGLRSIRIQPVVDYQVNPTLDDKPRVRKSLSRLNKNDYFTV